MVIVKHDRYRLYSWSNLVLQQPAFGWRKGPFSVRSLFKLRLQIPAGSASTSAHRYPRWRSRHLPRIPGSRASSEELEEGGAGVKDASRPDLVDRCRFYIDGIGIEAASGSSLLSLSCECLRVPSALSGN